jgi:hypothetical protein
MTTLRALSVLLLFSVTTFAQAQTGKSKSAPLAPACGPNNITYHAEDSDQPASTLPNDPANARIYFILDDGPVGRGHQHFTIKVATDGAWVGALNDNAWFAISVPPGERHFCANVQSKLAVGQNVALAHLTVEPGKTYYFRVRFIGGLNTQYPIYPYLQLDQPDTDEAQYLISSYPLSLFHPGK